MMVLLVLYKSKCKSRSLSDQHLEAVIKAAVDQEEQLAAMAKRSSSSSYCSGHGLCRCSPSNKHIFLNSTLYDIVLNSYNFFFYHQDIVWPKTVLPSVIIGTENLKPFFLKLNIIHIRLYLKPATNLWNHQY